MNFYVPLPDGTPTLQQGDLLANVPFTYFSITDVEVTLLDGQSERRDLSQNPSNVSFLAASVKLAWGIVLSQTCDVQPDPTTGFARKPLVVARVSPIKLLVRDFKDDTLKQAVNAVSNLATAGKAPTLFYPPAYRADDIDFPKSGVNLLDVQRFEPKDLPALTRLVKLRLGHSALQALQERCAYCFGRFAVPDDLFFSAEEWGEMQRQQQARLQSQTRQS